MNDYLILFIGILIGVVLGFLAHIGVRKMNQKEEEMNRLMELEDERQYRKKLEELIKKFEEDL